MPDIYPLPVKVIQHQYRELEHSLPYNGERGVGSCAVALVGFIPSPARGCAKVQLRCFPLFIL
ncbi:hypothetical protein HALO59_40175 [Halomonas sp. 59]|nr:hypothetical protein HALO156_160080 [Halomonas sp. 156]CAD5276671.1 hypothetical protein HALO113_50068 [Halomonas sp. 113]CAD5278169.1 hypothetical protein HALO59_40175 [Halomonas sp. 59]VXC04181.1 hypothetical protein HALO98_40323 [Halomonas titanicae]VXC75115.1 hypothetical protein HALO153_70068 [Halomonas titanicae]